MTIEHTDILISGGGVAGLSAACAFGSAGFSVICVDPAPPVTGEDDHGADLRSTAFLQPARLLLERAGLWQRLAPQAAPLQIMRIIDAGDDQHQDRTVADFDAHDISDAPFGWNLPNWLLRREMLARIGELPNVTFLPGVATTHRSARLTEARVRLSNGQTVACKLLIAADGRNSNIRQQCNISVKTMRYGQKALVFSVVQPQPHNNVSTEIHCSGGPFTMVPLPDLNGQSRSAVVWMDAAAKIDAALKMPVAEFEAGLLTRSGNLFGPLKLVSKRSAWPIISQYASRLSAQRTVLIAEAAHVVPPIGAQGLNMSLADIRHLLDLAIARPQGLGDGNMLSRYQRARFGEIKARVTGIDWLNRASMAQNATMQNLRRTGLRALHDIAPIRKTLMRAGLGAK